MAKNNSRVLLGFEDEEILEKHRGQVHFMTNKIGGEADFPSNVSISEKLTCSLCQYPSHLIVQVYAPLENSSFHRTLYLFACINSNCWNKTESWQCLRVQTKKTFPIDIKLEEPNAITPKISTTDWCVEADDWGDDEGNANSIEENSNAINNDDGIHVNDDDSNSFEESIQSGLLGLTIDETNGNNESQGGAIAEYHSPTATAEIEGNEGEVITVDTPTVPRTNLAALLQESLPLPQNALASSTPFVSHFMTVWPEEEDFSYSYTVDNHVKELLVEYQRKDSQFLSSPDGQQSDKPGGEGGENTNMEVEAYEESRPLHGDKMFHNFLTKIKENPEQILRYNREGSPLLFHPLQEPLKKCRYCQGHLTFELQLVPTIISKLRLECDPVQCSRLDFGTVLVYTCQNSCWSPSDVVKNEIVVVQSEKY